MNVVDDHVCNQDTCVYFNGPPSVVIRNTYPMRVRLTIGVQLEMVTKFVKRHFVSMACC
jgi:hypothetical protein